MKADQRSQDPGTLPQKATCCRYGGGTDAQISPRSSLAGGCRQRTSQNVRGVQSLCSSSLHPQTEYSRAQNPPAAHHPPRSNHPPVQESTVKARRSFQVPGASLPDPVEPVRSEFSTPQLASCRLRSLSFTASSLFTAVELNSAALRDVHCKQKLSTRSSTARGYPTPDARPHTRSILSLNPSPLVAPSGAPFIRSPTYQRHRPPPSSTSRPYSPLLTQSTCCWTCLLPAFVASPDGLDPSLWAEYIQTKSTPPANHHIRIIASFSGHPAASPANLCSHCLMFS